MHNYRSIIQRNISGASWHGCDVVVFVSSLSFLSKSCEIVNIIITFVFIILIIVIYLERVFLFLLDLLWLFWVAMFVDYRRGFLMKKFILWNNQTFAGLKIYNFSSCLTFFFVERNIKLRKNSFLDKKSTERICGQ